MPYYTRLISVIAAVGLVASIACGGSDDNKSSGNKIAPPTGPTASTDIGAASTQRPATPGVAPAAANGANFDMEHAQTTPSGLKYIDTVEGTGDNPKPNQSVVVNYTGKLASNGKVFDSSVNRGPATFPVGGVIKGFAEGILGMKPGGKRTILIPAALAYGSNPPPGSGIPANADLIFDIELISVK